MAAQVLEDKGVGFGMVDSEKDAAVAKKLGKGRRSRKRKVASEERLKFAGVWLGVPGSPLFLTENHAQISERGGTGLLCTHPKNRATCWRKGGIREHKCGWRSLRKLLFQPLPHPQSCGPDVTAPDARGQHRPETGLRMWMGEGWSVMKSSGQ